MIHCPLNFIRYFRHKTVLFALLVVAILLFPSGGFAATSVGGRISTDTTWTLSGSPYIVTSSVQFYGTTSTPITLTIEPGVVVKFQTGTYLQIANGTNYPAVLSAAGTAGAPIIFTSYKDDTAGGDTNGDGSATSPAPGNWNYVSLWQGSSSSVLGHTEVRYGGGGGQGTIYVYESSPAIQDSVITQSSNSGISIFTQTVSSAPNILNNQILQNSTYGIKTQSTYTGTTPVSGLIQGNTISSSGQYGMYFDGVISATIQNNQIAQGIYFTSTNGSPVLTGNQIMDLGSVTVQVPADIIEVFQTQNTLQGIAPTTSLNVVGDTMTGTTTLTTQWYSYIVVSGTLSVNGTTGNPATLVIQAGVRMSFASNSGISVGSSTSTPGILKVLGTSALPVTFTKSGTSAWPGIYLYSGTVGAQTIMQYATLEYAGTGTSPTTAGLSIYSSPTLENVTVRYSGPSGILLSSASPTMTNITVDQVGGDGISINGGSGTTTPTITQAIISNAGRYGIYVNGTNGAVGGTIQGSTILTPVSYGLYINQGAPTFLNNSIDGSLFMTNQSGLPVFTDNTIRHFSTKTGRISIGVLQQLQTQNTLLDIDPSTVMELNGTTVSTNTTLGFRWKIYNVVTGNITVSGTSPVTLTINPGVTMRFAASSYLGVSDKGILSARGTSIEPILLTTLNPAPNNWRGIVFNGNAVAGASLLEYVTVDQGGKQDAAIYGSSTAFTMNHCTISNSSMYGIQLYSADLTMQSSRVYNNSQRGLYVPNPGGSSDNSRVTIRNSDFYSNTQGAILNEQSTLSVDARNTWWGDATGPGGSGPGSGNSVSTKVLYDPWLGASYTYPFAITDAYPSSSSFTQGGGTTNLTADLTQTANWTVQITDSTSTVMKNASGSGRLINTSWDGTNTSGVPQPNGTYKFRMDATAGGSAAPVIGRIDLNNNLPIAQITDPVSDQLIVTPAVDIAGTANASSFTSYSVDVGLGTNLFQFMTLTNASSGPVVNGTLATWTLQSNPPSGIYQIRLKVTGNGGATAETTQFVRIDHVPPLPPELQQPLSPTATQPITVTGTAEADATVKLYVNDAAAGETTATGDGAFTFTNVGLTLGSNNLNARARDSANNTGSFSNKKTVVYLPAGESLIEILSPADGSTVYK